MAKKINWKKTGKKAGPILMILGGLGWLAGNALDIIEANETEERFQAIEAKVGINYEKDE